MKKRRPRPRKINVPCAGCGSVQRRSEASIPESKRVFCKSCRTAKGENHHNWKDGQYVDRAGYRMILIDGLYKREHLMVWEQANKASRLKGAQVHHINQIKLDNRPENLVLLTATEHAQLHRAIDNSKWWLACEILVRGGLRQLFWPTEIDVFLQKHQLSSIDK